MGMAQFAGLGVTTAVVLSVELPIDWLCLLAMSCGGLTIFAVRLLQE